MNNNDYVGRLKFVLDRFFSGND